MPTPVVADAAPVLVEPRVPGTTLTHKLIALAVLLLSFSYLYLFCRSCSMEPDEGIVLQGAERVLHGQVPYRDFFTFYTPGSFYFLASWLRLFGNSFVSARASIAFTGALCSLLTYLLARRVCSTAGSLVVAFFAVATGTAFRFLILHNWYSTLLALLAVYAGVRGLESSRMTWAFAAGLFASLTILFEQSKGGGLVLGLVLGFGILHVFDGSGRLRRPELSSMALGLTLPFLLTAVYFAEQRCLRVMLRSWFWPLGHYTRANHVPYGFQNWSDSSRELLFHSGSVASRVLKFITVSPDLLLPAVPLIAVGLLVYSTMKLRRDKEVGNLPYYVLICSAISGLLISVVISRADILHFVYLAPFLCLVLAWLLESRDFGSRLLTRVRPVLALYLVGAFGLLAMAMLISTLGNRTRLETRRGVVNTGGTDTVVSYVDAHVPAGGTLLVHPYLPLYNFLSATYGPAGYDYFQPGMNTPSQAQQIVHYLQANPERPVLFEPWFSEKIAHSWPGTPVSAIAQDPVADYIVKNYRVCALLNSPDGTRFHYMVRRLDPCPTEVQG